MKKVKQCIGINNSELELRGREELILQVDKLTKFLESQSKMIEAQAKKIREQDTLIRQYMKEVEGMKIELEVLKNMIERSHDRK
jgi:hypothetical protein